VSALVIVAGFWRLWGRWRQEPDEVTKIAIGCFIAAAGMGCLAAGALLSGDHKVSVLWVLAFIVLNELGFANVAPVSLALYARAAPPAMASTIIGLFYLHLFAANNLTGWIGGFLDRMPAAQFWLMHAGMGLGAGLVFVVAKQLFGTVLTPRGEEPPLTEAAAILDARELPTT
jgi:POT family proton-dependent oligopeptide transporter